MLELAVLGLLREQDMHGYEVKRRLTDLLGPTSGVSFGSLYPALTRLLAAGAVRVLGLPATRTDEPARRRKVYSVTPKGLALFEQLLSSASVGVLDERSFSVALAFAAHLPAEGRLRMFERRRSALAARLSELASRTGQGRGGRYGELLSQRERDHLSRDVSWLDRLIAEERTNQANSHTERPGWPGKPLRTPVPLASASQLHRGRSAAGQLQTALER